METDPLRFEFVTPRFGIEGLKAAEHPAANVLNGIAYDQNNMRLFVTGKLWSNLYEIELAPTE